MPTTPKVPERNWCTCKAAVPYSVEHRCFEAVDVTSAAGPDPAPFDPNNPTPYPDVNAVLRTILCHVRAALGDHFRGMYLFGSLVAGDFDPRRSDVDVVVVTDAEISDDQFAALHAMHLSMAATDSPWATEVEAYYLTQDALRRDHPLFGSHLKVNRGGGVLEPSHYDSGWIIQGHILREHGVAIVGPGPRTLIDPVSPDDLRRVVGANAGEWLGPVLGDPDQLRRRGFQTYLVLTICRMLYTFTTGAVTSKQVAGRWALATMGGRWMPLIERALSWLKDLQGTQDQENSEVDVRETLDLIRFTLKQCQAPA